MTELPDIRSLWDFQNPEASETVFREWLDKLSDDESYRLQLLTQIARTHSLRMQFEQAHSILDDVEPHISVASVVEVRYLLERGRTFNSGNQAEQALPLFTKAWEVAQGANEHILAVDAAHMVAIAEPDPAEQLAWNQKTLDYAEAHSIDSWLGSLYNNIGWTLHDMERYDEALAIFQRALAWREARDDTRATEIAKWSVGRALRSLGRFDEALAIQQSLLDTNDGFVDEEMGECLLALGRADEAKPYFQKAYTALSEIIWIEAERLERLQSLS